MHSGKTLVILGMHRSGTSLITQWLHKCGLYVGDKLLGAGVGNTDGHYEDEEFLAIHEKILLANGFSNTGLACLEAVGVPEPFEGQLKTCIQRRVSLAVDWGWKDPRTCLFLPTYRRLVPDAKYLVIVRSFKEVVSSLLKRDLIIKEREWLQQHTRKIDHFKWKLYKKRKATRAYIREMAQTYLKIHICYNQKLKEHLEQLDKEQYLVVDYKKLLKVDRNCYEHFQHNWHFHLHYVPFSSIFKERLISDQFDLEQVLPQALQQEAVLLEEALTANKPF